MPGTFVIRRCARSKASLRDTAAAWRRWCCFEAPSSWNNRERTSRLRKPLMVNSPRAVWRRAVRPRQGHRGSAAGFGGRCAWPARHSRLGQLTQRCGVLHRSQGAQVAVVGRLAEVPPADAGRRSPCAWDTRRSSASGLPSGVRNDLKSAASLIVVSTAATPPCSARRSPSSSPQPASIRTPSGRGLHVVIHFGLQPCRDIAGGWDVAAQEAHYVPAEERRQAVVDQPRIQPCQRPAVTEQDVGGPFALVGRPVSTRSGKPGTSSRAAGSGCGQ